MVRDALASWDGPRDEVLIANKTGYRRTMEAPNVAENEPERQHLQAVGSQYGWMADSRPKTMICDAKESAAHLGVEALDLLYSHGPDPEVAYEDQVGALKQLLDEGVIRYAGHFPRRQRADRHRPRDSRRQADRRAEPVLALVPRP